MKNSRKLIHPAGLAKAISRGLMATCLLMFTGLSGVFAQVADMSLAGTPKKATKIADNEYRLTLAEKNQAGSVWSKDFIDLKDDFVIEADIFLGGGQNGSFGDGIAFVLQPLCTGLGVQGSGLGYQGISPSFAIEFDNVSNEGGEVNDPKFDHIAFMLNGNVNHKNTDNHLGTFEDGEELENGKYHAVVIKWDATKQIMSLTLTHSDGTKKEFTSNKYSKGDMIEKVFGGKNLVYWGFTASTGSWVNEHKVKLKKWPARNIAPYNVTDASSTAKGKIEVTMEGTGMTYSWDDGSTDKVRSDLNAGTYKLTIKDASNCESVFDIKVNNLPEMLGHWTFEKGNERTDLTGNFESLTLINSSIEDGYLIVNDNQWAVANMTSDKTITEKTLVAWAKLDDLKAIGGSILSTVNRPSKKEADFDGIVYAEREPGKWMAGSGVFARTENPSEPTANYKEKTNTLVKLAIVYSADNSIKVYRNGILIGNYTKGSLMKYTTTDVYFGIRHATFNNSFPGNPWVFAHIEEARIYGGTLTQEQIANLTIQK